MERPSALWERLAVATIAVAAVAIANRSHKRGWSRQFRGEALGIRAGLLAAVAVGAVAVIAVFCLLGILSAEVTTLKAGWTRFEVRVAGSWIAAAGILIFGWRARPLV